jgi:hypothetical protein
MKWERDRQSSVKICHHKQEFKLIVAALRLTVRVPAQWNDPSEPVVSNRWNDPWAQAMRWTGVIFFAHVLKF